MRLKQFVEAPIEDYTTLSDRPDSKPGDSSSISKDPEAFAKRSSSFTDKRDRILSTNPKAVQQLKKKWARIGEEVYVYVVNTKEARNHTEVGVVDREWLEKNMPAVAPHIPEHEDGITILYTNNKGAEKVPMTPWIMAHRLAHAMARMTGMSGNRTISEYSEAERSINEVVNTILQDEYGYRGPTKRGSYRDEREAQSFRRFEILRRKFFEEIGTFRSARNKKLREDFEFLNEVIAQYIITGKITFNPIPQKIVLKKAWGNDADGVRLRGDPDDANQMLDTLSRDLEYYIENMFSQSIGRIFVM